jgi:hypothetical protein
VRRKSDLLGIGLAYVHAAKYRNLIGHINHIHLEESLSLQHG